jgi:hypothetical protein
MFGEFKHTSQLTTIFSKTSWASPQNRRLYTLYTTGRVVGTSISLAVDMFEEDGQTRTHPSCGRGKIEGEKYKKRKSAVVCPTPPTGAN